jgi:hypothetical protein
MKKITALIVTGAIGMACAGATGPEQPNFGAQYRVVLEPDPPVLAAGSLSVTVSYGGCGNNREFVLRHRIRTDTEADIWLQKVTPDESCHMLVTERRVFPIPPPVRYVAAVTLLTRDNDPLQLRP